LRGPSVYENWRALSDGTPSFEAYEFPLFTDARIVGNPVNVGPYLFLNSVAIGGGPIKPALFVRVEVHIDNALLPMQETDTTTYHGGYIDDEIAALTSLALGMRMKSGATTRRFTAQDNDPRGVPVAYEDFGAPLFRQRNGLVLPSAKSTAALDDVKLLLTIPSLPPLKMVALIRAARFYQEAIWLCESETAMAWLLLVSAVECIAGVAVGDETDMVALLRDSKPELVQMIESLCVKLLEPIAKEFAPTSGVTKKFITFLMERLPPAPQSRPDAAIPWATTTLKPILKKIYGFRSKALHSGIPFPAPMCIAPGRDALGRYDERPSGLATATQGGVWTAEDAPMHFHVFEYIARAAILSWWASASETS
jgi:hypothetical protein